MKNLYRLFAAASAAFFIVCEPAIAQWQVPDHSVPVGRGAGIGFKFAAPGTAGLPLTSQGASSDPTFSAIGSSALAFTQNGTGAVSQTFDQLYRAKIVTPEMFGALCNGTDDGPAIQRAVTYAGTIKGTVRLAPCTYTVVTPIVDAVGIDLEGTQGIGSQILFAPTANGIAYRVRNAGQIVVGGAMRNLRFYSDDATFTKTAIEIEDISRYTITNVSVQGGVVGTGGTGFWSGGTGSIGLRTRGREFTWVENFTSVADRPILVSDNPNSTIDSDWGTFKNLYLISNGSNPNFEIESGVNFSHMSIDGIACVLGTYCVFNNDTTAVQISQAFSIRGVGGEQGVSAPAFNIFISRPATGILYGLTLDGFQLWDPGRQGIYMRNVRGPRLSNIVYEGGGGCFDTDSSVRGLSWSSSNFLACTTAAFLGQNRGYADSTPAGTTVLPRNAVYISSAENVALHFQGNPANPTGTTSAVGVMMGIGSTCAFTPRLYQNVRVEIKGNMANSLSGNSNTVAARYGTGAAPANGVALAGTVIGNTATGHAGANNLALPFTVGGIITGLTINTAYWFDVSDSINAAGTGTLTSIGCDAFELP